MSEDCLYCKIVGGEIPVKKIYEDEKVLAFLKPNPASFGHILIIPKAHYTIIEQVPDFEVGKLFNVSNKLCTAAFETLGAGGTNILTQNGVAAGQSVPHFAINIIPRKENDGLNFQWQPKQLSQEEMSTVELKLKDASHNIGGFQKSDNAPMQVAKQLPEKIKEKKGEENYLIKQLDRMP